LVKYCAVRFRQSTPAAIGNLCRFFGALNVEKSEERFLICDVTGDQLATQALIKLSPLVYLLF
jgi:hypothetical protein